MDSLHLHYLYIISYANNMQNIYRVIVTTDSGKIYLCTQLDKYLNILGAATIAPLVIARTVGGDISN